jgi:rhodanese-related sulfurtransferase
MTAVRQALWILLIALVPAFLTSAFHPKRPAWSQDVLQPGEERLGTVLSWGDSVLWVDARSRTEFDAEHIPNAVLLNLEEWDQLFPAFLDRWQPDQKVVVYCSTLACHMSTEVADRLKRNSVGPVYVLKGGWEAWKSHK